MNKIIKAKNENIEKLAALFAKGFMKDPLFCHYIPYEEEREGILNQIFRKYLYDCWDILTVYQTEDGNAALCIYPPQGEPTERMMLPASLQGVYERISQAVAPQFYKDYLTLDLIAVNENARGRGYARALIEAFIKDAKEAGKKGVVEIYNPHNVAFYEKMGFKLAHIQPLGDTLSAYLLEV
ncbi:MAG: GNAT family N-acetyltransferase [Clostridia bacterium]|nr:GNAT family N-acetyltransferase [Clostridia bacterium]